MAEKKVSIHPNTKHGMEATVEYSAWQAAKNRCFNPRYVRFDCYGGRGITMCDEWRSDFAAFYSHMGPRPIGTELDRINNNGNYEPGNCRWTDRRTQNLNQRRAITVFHEGKTIPLKDLAAMTGIPYITLYHRYKKGLLR